MGVTFNYNNKNIIYKNELQQHQRDNHERDADFCHFCFFFFFNLIGIHSMQGWTATTRHGVTRKISSKRLRHTGNLFRKNLQLKDVC